MSNKLHTLSNDPYLYYIDNFLTDKECDFMIKHSKEHLKIAGVSFLDKDAHKLIFIDRSSAYKMVQNL